MSGECKIVITSTKNPGQKGREVKIVTTGDTDELANIIEDAYILLMDKYKGQDASLLEVAVEGIAEAIIRGDYTEGEQ